MKPPPITRLPVTLIELQRALDRGCTDHGPSCRHPAMTIVAGCHPASPTFTLYVPAIGGLRIVCATCHTVVVEVAVAGELDSSKAN